MNNLLQDLRLALRQLRRSPGFVFSAVLILALGIAANVIVFGVLQGLILQPLNVPHPERVQQLARTNEAFPMFGFPEVRDIRDNNTVFSAVGACTIWSFGLETNGISRPIVGYEVSGQYFEVAAIKPFLGRLLDRADDDYPGVSDAVVLSWPAWNSYFGADPNVVGKKLRLNKHPYTIVGVTPQTFYGTEKFLEPDVFRSDGKRSIVGRGELAGGQAGLALLDRGAHQRWGHHARSASSAKDDCRSNEGAESEG